jgi:hypothetical protein
MILNMALVLPGTPVPGMSDDPNDQSGTAGTSGRSHNLPSYTRLTGIAPFFSSKYGRDWARQYQPAYAAEAFRYKSGNLVPRHWLRSLPSTKELLFSGHVVRQL